MTFETYETFEASRDTEQTFEPRNADDDQAIAQDARIAYLRSPNLQYCIAHHLV